MNIGIIGSGGRENSICLKLHHSKKVSKILNKKNKIDLKNFYIFSLTSLILIFSFFSLPSITGYLVEKFFKNQIVINVSKKNFEIKKGPLTGPFFLWL